MSEKKYIFKMESVEFDDYDKFNIRNRFDEITKALVCYCNGTVRPAEYYFRYTIKRVGKYFIEAKPDEKKGIKETDIVWNSLHTKQGIYKDVPDNMTYFDIGVLNDFTDEEEYFNLYFSMKTEIEDEFYDEFSDKILEYSLLNDKRFKIKSVKCYTKKENEYL